MKVINSISEKHRLLTLPEPQHPMISLVRIADLQVVDDLVWKRFCLNFYCISLKRNVKSKMQYGHQYYDYDKGLMTFVAPKQVMSLDATPVYDTCVDAGYALFFHPDFIRHHPLASRIADYGFFSYSVNEALHLSEKEEKDIVSIFEKIDEECKHIDRHTQEVIISMIELMLNYSNRFYERQFITRKAANHDVLKKTEKLLNNYFEQITPLKAGIPTVEFLATQLNLSPHYLSDLLKSITGLTAQQHIQDALIEKAKQHLAISDLSVAEIAYQLGFKHPQSLNKLFKRKTSISPLEFRKQFN